MTNIVTFRVHGIPIQQGSKNAYPSKGRRKVNVVESKHHELQAWRRIIAAAWSKAGRVHVAGPVAVTLRFFMPRPKSHFGTGRNAGKVKPSAPYYAAVKPDIDKLERGVLDALTIAGAIEDDARVVSLDSQKPYANTDEQVGVIITIASMADARL